MQCIIGIFKNEVKTALTRTASLKPDILTQNDLVNLPPAVKKYLNYTRAIGKEKIMSMKLHFKGRMRSKPDSGWMPFKSEQYNFFDKPTRIFYIEAKKAGIPVKGLHLYKGETAIMVIKLAGLFKIADAKGPEMDQGETVTVFNDMCFMAPATLIDKNIYWEEIDQLTVKARYTNRHISISATLLFNEKGELINFISNNRFETSDGKIYNNYPWSTPAQDYRDFNGMHLISSASTFYAKPHEDFCYGEFFLKDLEYNCTFN